MSLTSALAVYFIIWWIVLFAVLPIGLRTQEEEGEVTPGTVPSAPAHPQLLKKAVLTTVVASVVFAFFFYARLQGWLDILPPLQG